VGMPQVLFTVMFVGSGLPAGQALGAGQLGAFATPTAPVPFPQQPLGTQSVGWVQGSPTTPPPPSSIGPHAASPSSAPATNPHLFCFMDPTPFSRGPC